MADTEEKRLNLSGTSGVTYDLDEIVSEARANGDKPLVVQVHEYKQGESSNPKNLQIGQIWLSKKV